MSDEEYEDIPFWEGGKGIIALGIAVLCTIIVLFSDEPLTSIIGFAMVGVMGGLVYVYRSTSLLEETSFFSRLFYVLNPSSEVNKLLTEYNMSRARFNELYSGMGITSVSPLKFLEAVYQAEIYYEDGNPVPLERILVFLTPRLRWVSSNTSELKTEVLNILMAYYDSYLVDTYAGGGWLPPRETFTRVEPFRFGFGNDAFQISPELPVLVFEHEYERHLRVKFPTIAPQKLCCFRLALSGKDDMTPSQMERFWSSLQTLDNPVALEIVSSGSDQQIVFQLICQATDKNQIANQLGTLFPNSSINPDGSDDDYLMEKYIESKESLGSNFETYGRSFGLSRHYSHQLRVVTSFDKTDPLLTLINPLATLKEGEGAVIQALIAPLESWDNHLDLVQQSVSHFKFEEFKNCPIAQKRKFPLFAVCFRVMAFGNKETVLRQTLNSVEQTLAPFKSPQGNAIVTSLAKPINHDTPPIYEQIDTILPKRELVSILERSTYRHGFILNTQELASLCHFPHKDFQHPKLLRAESSIGKAPESVTEGKGLLIGTNEVFNKIQEVYVPEDFRFRHIYIVGKTGIGKTTLLYNMLKADIEAGKGVGLIDPHGDLTEQVLKIIPEHRIDDVVLFDPSDYEHPIGFNMMQASNANPHERRQMRTDILVSIRRLFEGASWGDNIDQLFRVSIATLLADITQTHTLPDIRNLIGDEVFRSQVLKRIDDDYLLEFWREDFSNFTRATTSAVRRRLSSILNEPEVRTILSQRHTSFNFKEVMDTKKIFLAKLQRGTLGEDISRLFGGLLVSKIQLTAMARDSQPEEERVPFYLYVDEFQNFVNESFEVILSEARKYKLALTIAHQFTAQLPPPIYNAVFGNVGSLIVFETGVDDATALEKQLGKFSKDDIINLERFHTFTRIGKARDTFSMKTLPPPEVETDVSERVRNASRTKYCRITQPEPQRTKEPSETEAFVEPEPTPEELEREVETPSQPAEKNKEDKEVDFFE